MATKKKLPEIPQHFAGLQDYLEILAKEYLETHPGFAAYVQKNDPALLGKKPAALNEELACYPGVIAIAAHGLAHELYKAGDPKEGGDPKLRVEARRLSEAAKTRTGIDIHPGTDIGEDCFIDHGTAVVIGETSQIGKHTRIYHETTLGAYGKAEDPQERHPVIGDDCLISVGAKILGHVRIGNNVTVSPNALLLGNHLTIGNDVTIGTNAQIGDRNEIGDDVRINTGVVIYAGTGKITKEDINQIPGVKDGVIPPGAKISRGQDDKLVLTGGLPPTAKVIKIKRRQVQSDDMGYQI